MVGRRVYRGYLLFHGRALVCTMAQTFEFHAQPAGQVAIQVEGRPPGSLQPDGTLLDAEGQPIGRRPSSYPDKDQATYPVTVQERVVGRPENPFYGGRLRSLRQMSRPPAVEITAPDVTAEEQDWLLALAFWNVLFPAAIQVDTSGIV
ncbi:MAG TPA: hypothetical protein EYP56_22415 [Planctomycetaceae bacterium]|nr:hypothetical protein [Planctomycetaceae bacterium]HIQ20623.1 hypothetical protein [Planctomycetota bacterium]